MENIRKEIGDILAMLDADKAPEAYHCLAALYADEDEEYDGMEIANALINCDSSDPMMPIVFNFVRDLYLEEIRSGNPDAMNDLGSLYYDGGRGCRQDFGKAFFYYNMAAEHGNRQAQENLGYCYYYGRNVPVNYEKAFHYFLLGALDGHLISLYKIGDMYLNGYYVPRNETEAFCIYRRCMEMMTDEAAKHVAGPVYLRLGNAFLKGQGTEADPQSALVCYQKAEVFLYEMVKSGDVMYKNSLKSAIAGQAAAREVLAQDLPRGIWLDGIRP